MKPAYKKIIYLLVIITVIILVRRTELSRIITLEQFKLYKDQLAVIVAEHYVLSAVFYIFCYILVSGLSIPGATILTISGGYLFKLAGILYVNIGATTGAVIAFLSSRYLLGSWIQEKYKDRFTPFNKEIEAHGYNYMLTLRLIPIFPFFIINLLAGITKIPLGTFLWTTSLGIIPGSFVYVYTGTQASFLEKFVDIISWRVAISLLLLAFFSLLPVFVKKIKKRRMHNEI